MMEILKERIFKKVEKKLVKMKIIFTREKIYNIKVKDNKLIFFLFYFFINLINNV